METRQLLKMDESRYRRLRLEAAKETPWQRTSDLDQELALIERGPASILAKHDRGGTRVWGAFHDLYLVGVVALSEVQIELDEPQQWLWGLYVLPRFRGTPVSRCLMAAAQEWVEGARPGAVLMGAYHRDNRFAWQVVGQFGFQASAQRSEAKNAGLLGEDEILVEVGSPSLGRALLS